MMTPRTLDEIEFDIADAADAADACWPGWYKDPAEVRAFAARIAAAAYRRGVADAASSRRFDGSWEED